MTARPEPYMTAEDLADFLHISKRTIENRISLIKRDPGGKHAELLPPASRVPGVKGPRWAPHVVQIWASKFDPIPAEEKRRPGRPTKLEEIAKRLSQNVAKVS